MSDDTKLAVQLTAIGTAALLAIWFGVRLIGAIFATLGPIVGSAVGSATSFISFVIRISTDLLVIVVAIAAPLLILAGCAVIMVQLFKSGVGRLQELNQSIAALRIEISRQARDAAVDAGFLAVLALLSGLVFFITTRDFLDVFVKLPEESRNHIAIRVLAVAGVACSISKMLLLIPVRSLKVISFLTTIIVLLGTWFVLQAYLNLGPLGSAAASALWSRLLGAPPPIIFVTVVSSVLLLLAILYPVTLTGWRRVLRA